MSDQTFEALGSTDLVPVRIDGQLPVLPDTDQVDYKALLPMKAALPITGALIAREYQDLAVSDPQRADNLRYCAGGILDLVSEGRLTTMEDVQEIVFLAQERRPSIRKVEELIVTGGLNAVEVAAVYGASDAVGTNIQLTPTFFKSLGLSPTNEDDVELAASLIETVKEMRGIDPRFTDIAANIVMQLVDGGTPIGNILDGEVF